MIYSLCGCGCTLPCVEYLRVHDFVHVTSGASIYVEQRGIRATNCPLSERAACLHITVHSRCLRILIYRVQVFIQSGGCGNWKCANLQRSCTHYKCILRIRPVTLEVFQ